MKRHMFVIALLVLHTAVAEGRSPKKPLANYCQQEVSRCFGDTRIPPPPTKHRRPPPPDWRAILDRWFTDYKSSRK